MMKPQFRHCKWIVLTLAFVLAVSWTDHGYADAPPGRYSISNGTVYDTKTKLTWQQAISTNWYTWADAKTYCSSLVLNGPSPWRLPSLKELQTIVDRTRTYPAIDQTAFPDVAGGQFWTYFAPPGSPSAAALTNFNQGDTGFDLLTNPHRVLCVR